LITSGRKMSWIFLFRSAHLSVILIIFFSTYKKMYILFLTNLYWKQQSKNKLVFFYQMFMRLKFDILMPKARWHYKILFLDLFLTLFTTCIYFIFSRLLFLRKREEFFCTCKQDQFQYYWNCCSLSNFLESAL